MKRPTLSILLVLIATASVTAAEDDWENFRRHIGDVYYPPLIVKAIEREAGRPIGSLTPAVRARMHEEAKERLSRDNELAARLVGYALGEQLRHVVRDSPEHRRWLALERAALDLLRDMGRAEAGKVSPTPTPEQIFFAQQKLRNLFQSAVQGRENPILHSLTGVAPGTVGNYFAMGAEDLVGEWELGELDDGRELPESAWELSLKATPHGWTAEHAEGGLPSRSWKLVDGRLLWFDPKGALRVVFARRDPGNWQGLRVTEEGLLRYRTTLRVPTADQLLARPNRYLKKASAAGPGGPEAIVGRWRLATVTRDGKEEPFAGEWRLTIEIKADPAGAGKYLATVVDVGDSRARKVKVFLYARCTHQPEESVRLGRTIFKTEMNSGQPPRFRDAGNWFVEGNRMHSASKTWLRED